MVEILNSELEYKIRKEAAWAVLNATSGGTSKQIRYLIFMTTLTYHFTFILYRYLVSIGCIKPLCDLLTIQDSRLVVVTLEGLENILKAGEKEDGSNMFSSSVEEAYGMLLEKCNNIIMG